MIRSQSKLSGDSAYSQNNRLRWLKEKYAAMITDGGLYTDFRVNIVELETGRQLMRIGGILHNWSGKYLTPEEELELNMPITTTWEMNGPQTRGFALLPMMLDRDRLIPIGQVQVRGGRRTGKTEYAIRLSMSFAVVYPYARIGIFGLDHKSNTEMLAKISALLPDEWYSHYDKTLNTLHLRNGSTITFFSQLNYKKAGRSYSFDVILLDEPTFYANTHAVLDGCRGAVVQYDGAIISVYTPPVMRETMYWEEQKSRSADPELNQSIKTLYFGSTYENTTLSPKAVRKIKLLEKAMSESEYQREILGKWAKNSGKAMYDFKTDMHVIQSVPNYLYDITSAYCDLRWDDGAEHEWIAGMDFNESPMTMTLYKLYWDPCGGTLIQHHELTADNTDTSRFIQSTVMPWLRSQYPAIASDFDLARKILIVADASAWWQGAEAGKSRQAVCSPAYDHLKAAGFHAIQPKPISGRPNKNKSNKERHGKNPIRADRLDSFRGRLLDKYGYAHIYYLENCVKTIECVDNIPLYAGLPDLKSSFVHFYDAASYPVYNLYPRIQLFTTDPDELNKTYGFVYELGQQLLTEEQRAEHPIVKNSQKELVV